MNGKVYTLQDLQDLYKVARQEFVDNDWWGIVVTEYLYDEIKVNSKEDNEFEKLSDGISYVLYNNVWGTNFPLWYEENAHFEFVIGVNNNELPQR